MRKLSLALLALATALAISPAALADDFNFSFSTLYSTAPAPGAIFGEGAYGYGTLSGVEVSPGLYEITSGTIELFGGSDTYAHGTGTLVADPTPGIPATTSLSPLGQAEQPFVYDDLLYMPTNPSSAQELDHYGLLFWVDDSEVGISGNGVASNSYSIIEWADYLANGDPSDADAESDNIGGFNATSDAPEPPSWLLLGSGLLALTGVAYRRGVPHPRRAFVFAARVGRNSPRLLT